MTPRRAKTEPRQPKTSQQHPKAVKSMIWGVSEGFCIDFLSLFLTFYVMFRGLLCQRLLTFLALSVPCQARSHTPWRAKSSQDEPKMESRRSSWLIFAIFVPTSCEENSKMGPRSGKIAELVAKIAQNSAQEPPTSPSKTSKI